MVISQCVSAERSLVQMAQAGRAPDPVRDGGRAPARLHRIAAAIRSRSALIGRATGGLRAYGAAMVPPRFFARASALEGSSGTRALDATLGPRGSGGHLP